MAPKSPQDMTLEELLATPEPDALCQPPKLSFGRKSSRAVIDRKASPSPPDAVPSAKFHNNWLRQNCFQGCVPRKQMRDLRKERPWCPDSDTSSKVMNAHANPSPENPHIGAFDPDEVDWHFFQQALQKIKDASKRGKWIVHEDGTYLTEAVLKERQLLQNRGSIEEIEARLLAKGKICGKQARIEPKKHCTELANRQASMAVLVSDHSADHLNDVERRFAEDLADSLAQASRPSKRKRESSDEEVEACSVSDRGGRPERVRRPSKKKRESGSDEAEARPRAKKSLMVKLKVRVPVIDAAPI